jgi:hypothetical protein
VNLREIKQVKRDWPDRAMIVSIMVPCEEELEGHPARVEDTGADGIELNFGCPHGMSERGMGSAVGQVPEYIEMVAAGASRTPHAGDREADAQHHRYPLPGAAAKAGGADACRLINTISSITSVDLDNFSPEPTIDGKGSMAAIAGRRSSPSRSTWWPRSPAIRRRAACRFPASAASRPGAMRRSSSHSARHRAGLHRGDDLRLQDRPGDEIGPVQYGWTRRA